MKRVITTLLLTLGVAAFGFGLATNVSASATATPQLAAQGAADQCPNPPYTTKIDSSSGAASGDGFSFNYGPSALTYNVEVGTTLHICIKASTDIYEFTFVGPTSGTIDKSAFGGHDISHVSYYIVTTPQPTETTTSTQPTETTTTVLPTESTVPTETTGTDTTDTSPSTSVRPRQSNGPGDDAPSSVLPNESQIVPTAVDAGLSGPTMTPAGSTNEPNLLGLVGMVGGLAVASAGAISLRRSRTDA